MPPDPPIGLVAKANGEKRIDLNWINPKDFRRIDIDTASSVNGPFAYMDTTRSDRYSDTTNLRRNQARAYRLKALGWWDAQYSDYSNIASATTAANPPSKPILRRHINVNNGWEIGLVWTDSDNETRYVLERGVDNGPMSVIAILPANTMGYVDRNSIRPLTKYRYVLCADDEIGGNMCMTDTLLVEMLAKRIKITGEAKDVLTNEYIAQALVRLINETAKDSTETHTNAAGRYALDYALPKGDNHTLRIRMIKDGYYKFMEKFSQNYPNFGDVALDPFSTQVREDAENPGLDLLEHLSIMNRSPPAVGLDPEILYIAHHPIQNMPFKVYYKGRFNDSSFAEAKRGFSMMESRLWKLENPVLSESEANLVVEFGDYGSDALHTIQCLTIRGIFCIIQSGRYLLEQEVMVIHDLLQEILHMRSAMSYFRIFDTAKSATTSWAWSTAAHRRILRCLSGNCSMRFRTGGSDSTRFLGKANNVIQLHYLTHSPRKIFIFRPSQKVSMANNMAVLAAASTYLP